MGMWGWRVQVQAQPGQAHAAAVHAALPAAKAWPLTLGRAAHCGDDDERDLQQRGWEGARTVHSQQGVVCTLNCTQLHTQYCATCAEPSPVTPPPPPPTHCRRATGSRRSRRQRAHHDGGAQHREEVLRSGGGRSREGVRV